MRSNIRILVPVLALAAAGLHCKSKTEEGTPPTASEERALHRSVQGRLPADLVYAASTQVRVVDARRGAVVAKTAVDRPVTAIRFSPDGRFAYLGTSEGVWKVDAETHQTVAQLTSDPVRNLELDASGRTLAVLEHRVNVAADGSRQIEPFRLVSLDLQSGRVEKKEEIGQRILYAHAEPGLFGLVVSESGEVRLASPGSALSEAKPIDVTGGLSPGSPARPREFAAVFGSRAFVAVEGSPSRILEVDLEKGTSGAISLERPAPIRGVAVLSDGQELLVDLGMELALLDLRTRSVKAKAELHGAHTGLAVSADRKWAYLAQTVDGTGGAVTVFDVVGFEVFAKIHLDDISPWAIGVRPPLSVAAR